MGVRHQSKHSKAAVEAGNNTANAEEDLQTSVVCMGLDEQQKVPELKPICRACPHETQETQAAAIDKHSFGLPKHKI